MMRPLTVLAIGAVLAETGVLRRVLYLAAEAGGLGDGRAGEAEVDAAVARARARFRDWSRTSLAERESCLRRFAMFSIRRWTSPHCAARIQDGFSRESDTGCRTG